MATRRGRQGHQIRDRRVHPKLSVICNGSEDVNAIRAETAGCLRVDEALARSAPPLYTAVAPGQASAKQTRIHDLPRKRRSVEVNVFVEATDVGSLTNVQATQGELAIVRMPIDDVPQLLRNSSIGYVAQAESLKFPRVVRNSSGHCHGNVGRAAMRAR